MVRGIERKTAMLVSAALTVGGAGSIGMASEVKAQEASPSPVPSDVAVNPNETSNEVLLKNPNTGECTLVVFPPMETPVTSPLPEASPTQSAEPTMEPSFSPEPSAEPTVEADYTLWQACNDGEQPVATETANPTEPPVVEPTPSTEPTPEVTPEPQNLYTIISGKHPKVKASKITKELTNAYDKNPAATKIWEEKLVKVAWQGCQKDNHRTQHKFLNIEEACNAVVFTSYQIFQETGDENFYKLAKDAYNFGWNALPKNYRKDMNKYFEFNFPAEFPQK